MNLRSELFPAPQGEQGPPQGNAAPPAQRSHSGLVLAPGSLGLGSSHQARAQDRTVMGAPAAWSLELGRGEDRAGRKALQIPASPGRGGRGLPGPPWRGKNRLPFGANFTSL